MAVLLALALTAVVRATLVTTVAVTSTSMLPALVPGDRLVVWRPGAGSARTGDVVVVDGTGTLDGTGILAAAVPDGGRGWGAAALFVKRVVGDPGQRLACCAPDGRLEVDARPFTEPWVFPGDAPSETAFDVVVPPGSLWLLGDHRAVSTDSRALLGRPGGGLVARERVVGRVLAVAWPPDRWGRVQRAEGLASPQAPPVLRDRSR